MNKNPKVAIITGTTPVSLAQLGEKGVSSEILPRLFAMMGKEKFHFSVPAVGPAILASYLGQKGIEVVIFDYIYDKLDVKDCVVIGLSSTFMEPDEIRNIIRNIKSSNSSAPIVLGGPLSWVMSPEALLELIPEIDYLVLKEGEETFLRLIEAVSLNQDVSAVEGLMFRDKKAGTIRTTPVRKHIDIEKLPFPAWELMGIPSPKRLPVLFVESSRGCPYNCAYCSEVTYWTKPVRYRSPQRITDEISHNAQKFGIKTFRFTDSCFSAPPDRCSQVCDAIADRSLHDGLPVKWSAYSRIENLSPVLLDKMARAGCVALDVGLESGAPAVLKRMNKHYDPEVAVAVAKASRDSGIIINYNILIGFPGETRDTVQTSMDLIQRAAPDTFSCFAFLLRPNSAVYDRQQEFGIEGNGPSWKHATMTSDEAKLAQMKFTREITSSSPFPGGEHIACYFSSLGFSTDQIKKFYRAVTATIRDPQDKNAQEVLKAAVQKIAALS